MQTAAFSITRYISADSGLGFTISCLKRLRTKYNTLKRYDFLKRNIKKEYTLMVSFITPMLRSGITNFNVVPGVTKVI